MEKFWLLHRPTFISASASVWANSFWMSRKAFYSNVCVDIFSEFSPVVVHCCWGSPKLKQKQSAFYENVTFAFLFSFSVNNLNKTTTLTWKAQSARELWKSVGTGFSHWCFSFFFHSLAIRSDLKIAFGLSRDTFRSTPPAPIFLLKVHNFAEILWVREGTHWPSLVRGQNSLQFHWKKRPLLTLRSFLGPTAPAAPFPTPSFVGHHVWQGKGASLPQEIAGWDSNWKPKSASSHLKFNYFCELSLGYNAMVVSQTSDTWMYRYNS